MKEQKLITIFTCDQCGTKSKQCKKFPYEEGWTYLYNFAFKLADNITPMPKDKHFCSKECLIKYVNLVLERNTRNIVAKWYGKRQNRKICERTQEFKSNVGSNRT